MADDFQNSSGTKKAFPKTYGDVMKNIPAGQGERTAARGDSDKARKNWSVSNKNIAPVIIRKNPLRAAPAAPASAPAEGDAQTTSKAAVTNSETSAPETPEAAGSLTDTAAVQTEAGGENRRERPTHGGAGNRGGKGGGRDGRDGKRQHRGQRGDRGGYGKSAGRPAIPTAEDIDRMIKEYE